MKVLVCGGRTYDDIATVFRTLDSLHEHRPITAIAHGGAKGADSLAGQWARTRGIPVRIFPADFHRLGKAAGPIRNKKMFREFNPHVVVVFPGNRGTDNMASIARAAGTPIIRPTDESCPTNQTPPHSITSN